MKRVLAVVCPNGLGHFRRVTNLVERLFRRVSGVHVDLVCSRWQVDRMGEATWDSAPGSNSLTYLTGFTEPGVGWDPNPSTFDDGRLIRWSHALAGLAWDAYDVVLSDNLTGVLEFRHDALLSGCFLWSEVYEAAFGRSGPIGEFVAFEQDLLTKHEPQFFCIGALATPGVLALKRRVECNFWFYEDPAPARELKGGASSGPSRVAILGGATGASRHAHARVARRLARERSIRLVMPQAEAAFCGLDPGSYDVFRFGRQDYVDCDVVIARPGLGTVHEALAARVPLVSVYEAGQFEMSHVAGAIASLGLGLDAGEGADSDEVLTLVRSYLNEPGRARYNAAASSLKGDGMDQFADAMVSLLQS